MQSSSAQDHADQAAQQHLQSQGQDTRQQSSSQGQGNNIDPAISGGAMLAPNPQASLAQVLPQILPGMQDAAGNDSRKTYGKRELSTSKRAEQNRAAQRAFRQRKEGYIRQLEAQVKDFKVLSESYKALQVENFQLREYIISLQSRLIDSQNEVPALPDNIDLSQPRPEPPLADSHDSGSPAGPPQSQQSQSQQSQQQAAMSAAPASVPPLAPHQHHHQPSTAPSNGTNDEITQLNRIAVAGLGIRKQRNLSPAHTHTHSSSHAQTSQSEIGSRRASYSASPKRRRTDDYQPENRSMVRM
ncbi:putative transcription factor kapC [Talaromyces atroroseus]|uniref:Putative transcription factor kapC n=1 Tax=Talaromyces atroroseus TaxID=1441469 RepID=A0A225B701_TALAT|nr:putative transcription factor kapC [Talaromyces atroroseus]OKL61697.1 putative transcription factor kapC [Talaromyces atroroseus]